MTNLLDPSTIRFHFKNDPKYYKIARVLLDVGCWYWDTDIIGYFHLINAIDFGAIKLKKEKIESLSKFKQEITKKDIIFYREKSNRSEGDEHIKIKMVSYYLLKSRGHKYIGFEFPIYSDWGDFYLDVLGDNGICVECGFTTPDKIVYILNDKNIEEVWSISYSTMENNMVYKFVKDKKKLKKYLKLRKELELMENKKRMKEFMEKWGKMDIFKDTKSPDNILEDGW